MASSKLSRATDLHPFHFSGPYPTGGDLDAAFTPGEIAQWAAHFEVFDRFVLGTHSPNFFRIKTRLSPADYLHHAKASVQSAAQSFKGKIYFGLEGDFVIKRQAEVSFNPPLELIAEFRPDVSIVGFHFHDTLTYGGVYDLTLKEIEKAFEVAFKSQVFAAVAHPFEVLERVWDEDPNSFARIANLAKENRVAFEINADKGFYEASFKRLLENGNLFSFGSDLHSLSHWLKRDSTGLQVPDPDRLLVERVLGLANDAADMEKAFWREMDYLFREVRLSYPLRHNLKRRAITLYKSCLPADVFARRLTQILAHFGKLEAGIVGRNLRELDSVYRRWGGDITYEDRMLVEKYFLKAGLTVREVAVYEAWLERAYELGLKKEQLINSWETPRLTKFLARA